MVALKSERRVYLWRIGPHPIGGAVSEGRLIEQRRIEAPRYCQVLDNQLDEIDLAYRKGKLTQSVVESLQGLLAIQANERPNEDRQIGQLSQLLELVADKIFSDCMIEPLLQKVLDTSSEARQRKSHELQQCENRVAEVRRRLSNLYDAIEDQKPSERDPELASRIKERRAEIDALNTTAKVLRQQLEKGPTRITPAAVRRFGQIVREQLLTGDEKVRQNIARAFVDNVRVGAKVHIEGKTEALAHGAAAVARSKGAVPSFDRKWCRLADSNC